ncbi:MAG: YdeI/OmpD-associated family protein [Gemmatimonadales bacterium]|nr:YdeI/OmpD-associated family protein [Gemmatimonadales bacterium]
MSPARKLPPATEPPPELAAALRRTPGAAAAWKALAPSHQREHVEAVASAKQAETKARRVARCLEALLSGTKTLSRPSTKPLALKLGIKPGMAVRTFDLPDAVTLDGLPESARLAARGRGPFDAVIACFTSAADVERRAAEVTAAVRDGGLLWLCYPKQGGAVRADINRDRGWAPFTALGWHAVLQVAMNADWSALRFRR